MVCVFCGQEGATGKWGVAYTDWDLPICVRCDPGRDPIDAPDCRWDDAAEFVATTLEIPLRVAKLVLAVATDSNITDGGTPCEEADLLVDAIKQRPTCTWCGRGLFPEELGQLEGYIGSYCARCLGRGKEAIPLENVGDKSLEEGVWYRWKKSDGTIGLLNLSE